MRRIRSACCARAASGHIATPPANVMNSRRLIACPLRLRTQDIVPVQPRSVKGPMSALGHKWTFAMQKRMSALPPKADMCGAVAHVCFGPIADITNLFDQLVRASGQRQWHCDA
jgi:hypothetical protein